MDRNEILFKKRWSPAYIPGLPRFSNKCRICGKYFKSYNPKYVFCSTECRKLGRKIQTRDLMRKKRNKDFT